MRQKKLLYSGWRPTVRWWNNALYDTCSLITLEKILLDHPDMRDCFLDILTIEECLSEDGIEAETATRMRPLIKLQDLPPPTELARIFTKAHLSQTLAGVDQLVYATAVHSGLAVVTGDKALARAITKSKLTVGNIALILKELVLSHSLSVSDCDFILSDLVNRKDYVLPAKQPQNWATLSRYRFP